MKQLLRVTVKEWRPTAWTSFCLPTEPWPTSSCRGEHEHLIPTGTFFEITSICWMKSHHVPQVYGGRGGLQQSHFPGLLLFQGFCPQGHSTSGFRETSGGQTRSALLHSEEIWCCSLQNQVCILVCIFLCFRFWGGAEAGTREQAGPERAPESAERTFVHPEFNHCNIISDGTGKESTFSKGSNHFKDTRLCPSCLSLAGNEFLQRSNFRQHPEEDSSANRQTSTSAFCCESSHLHSLL